MRSDGLENGITYMNYNLLNVDPTEIYSVTELSKNIKQILSGHPQLNNVLLKGEITNFIKASSGHLYFSIKDENTAIACAFFKYLQDTDVDKDLCDGIQIVAMGSMTTYEPRCQYQLNIKKIIPIGNGARALRLRQTEENLEKEGLFDESRKKAIPKLPRKIGIITSKDSAAITDIFTVINSRYPMMNLVMAYVALQGDSAPKSIINGLESLSRIEDIDVVILARGGGPSEDLMAFNDEGLVRAMHSYDKPIITGIGHEKDTCLADRVSDLRASTPSTAAKAAVPDMQELKSEIKDLDGRLKISVSHIIELERTEIKRLRERHDLLKLGLERSYKSYLNLQNAKDNEVLVKRKEVEKLHNNLASLRLTLERSYQSYLVAREAREKEIKAKRDEINQLSRSLDSLEVSLQRSYDSYLKVQEKNAEFARREDELKQRNEEIKQQEKEIKLKVEDGKSEASKYKAIIAIMVVVIIIILLILIRLMT